ncbi:MAG TPA: hypothetical protein VGG90_04150 [Candidatus Dormibacteraeota bacterium]|jgi:hypothetical protein
MRDHDLNASRVVIGAAVIILGAVILAAATMGHNPAAPEVLPPASGPSVSGLCSASLSYDGAGNASPLFCAGGNLNRLAWRYYAGKQLSVMGLGIFAADTDVATALRQDLSGGAPSAVECNAYRLASAYYGWKFGFDPAAGILTPTCTIRIR